MLDINDYRHVEVSYRGKFRNNKLYRAYCDACFCDRGYKPKNYKSQKCNSCARKGKKLSDETKKKMSEASFQRYNDPNWKPRDRLKVVFKKKRLYMKKKTALQNKFSKNMRCLLSSKLRKRGLSKFRKSTFSILNYSVNDLMAHLESKFQLSMTWDNYGGKDGWEIDHITPDSWFKYSSMEDEAFKKSWSLDNLQPLWKIDNASKGDRYAKERK